MVSAGLLKSRWLVVFVGMLYLAHRVIRSHGGFQLVMVGEVGCGFRLSVIIDTGPQLSTTVL